MIAAVVPVIIPSGDFTPEQLSLVLCFFKLFLISVSVYGWVSLIVYSVRWIVKVFKKKKKDSEKE